VNSWSKSLKIVPHLIKFLYQNRHFLLNPEAEDIHLISGAIVRDIGSIEFLKDFLYNNRYSRFPPAYEGKTPKISFLEFKGLDESSTILIEVLKEVFKYEKFKTDVNNDVISRLGFIKVPVDKLKNRRVFEPLILATLADYISSGRIVGKHLERVHHICKKSS
jgi:hypothetical protein